MWPQFQLRDRPGDPAGPRMRPYGDWQTGLLYADGTPKPAFHEYGAPAFATCRRSHNRRWIEIWSRMRGPQVAATAQIEIRARTGRGHRQRRLAPGDHLPPATPRRSPGDTDCGRDPGRRDHALHPVAAQDNGTRALERR